MTTPIEIVGSFDDEHACARAIDMLRRRGHGEFRFFAPVPSEHLAEAVGAAPSPVRTWVLAGGIIGVVSALALTIGTSLHWNLIVGGKPIISLPPYLIIAFELMVLFGGIAAVLGFLFNSRLPSAETAGGYSSRFGADRFGVVVRCDEARAGEVEALLHDAGAQEVARERV